MDDSDFEATAARTVYESSVELHSRPSARRPEEMKVDMPDAPRQAEEPKEQPSTVDGAQSGDADRAEQAGTRPSLSASSANISREEGRKMQPKSVSEYGYYFRPSAFPLMVF